MKVWKCRHCGGERLGAHMCVSAWINVDINTTVKKEPTNEFGLQPKFMSRSIEVVEAYVNDINRTVDHFYCENCGKDEQYFDDIAVWVDEYED